MADSDNVSPNTKPDGHYLTDVIESEPCEDSPQPSLHPTTDEDEVSRASPIKRHLPPWRPLDETRSSSSSSGDEPMSSRRLQSPIKPLPPIRSQHTVYDSPAVREEMETTSPSGGSRMVITEAVQTEWSWLEDLKSVGRGFTSPIPILIGSEQGSPIEAAKPKTPGVLKIRRRRKRISKSDSSSSVGNQSVSTPPVDDREPDQIPESDDDVDIINEQEIESIDDTGVKDENSDVPNNFEEEDSMRAPSVETETTFEMSEFLDPDDLGIPSVGPPAILEYHRESQEVHMRPHKPPNDPKTAEANSKGIFGGQCEFCGRDIKPLPSIQQQQALPTRQLFCCDDYRVFLDYAMSRPFGPSYNIAVKKFAKQRIDIDPHPPFNQQARKVAKEKAALRMREREIERQKKHGAQQNAANFYAALNRTMKVVQFSLGSKKCAEDGWTLRPPSPLLAHTKDEDIFTLEAVTQDAVKRKEIIEKYYFTKQKFLTVFPDNSGTVFYPSGNPAIVLSSHEPGKTCYIIYDDTDDSPNTLAIFSSDSHGACYHDNRSIRLAINPLGGVLLDSDGHRKKKWCWKDFTQTHIHAPPIQPIVISLSKYLSLRVNSQENISLQFSCLKKNARFNVGVKMKVVSNEKIPKHRQDDDVIYLKDMQVYIRSLYARIDNVFKYAKSSKLSKIPLPDFISKKMEKRSIQGQPLMPISGKNKSETTNETTFPAVTVT